MKKISQAAIFVLNWVKHSSSLWVSLNLWFNFQVSMFQTDNLNHLSDHLTNKVNTDSCGKDSPIQKVYGPRFLNNKFFALYHQI